MRILEPYRTLRSRSHTTVNVVPLHAQCSLVQIEKQSPNLCAFGMKFLMHGTYLGAFPGTPRSMRDQAWFADERPKVTSLGLPSSRMIV